jgi:hypothetical protein
MRPRVAALIVAVVVLVVGLAIWLHPGAPLW